MNQTLTEAMVEQMQPPRARLIYRLLMKNPALRPREAGAFIDEILSRPLGEVKDVNDYNEDNWTRHYSD